MTNDSEKLASLGEPEHTVRQRLREDPDAQKIASELGVDIEDYISQVIFYARRPGLPPQVEVLSDEDMEELQDELPSQAEVNAWLEDVANGEVQLPGSTTSTPEQSEYTTEVDKAEQLRAAAMGGEVERRAPAVSQPGAPGPARPASILEQQILQQQRQAQRHASAPRANRPKGKE